MKTLKLVVTLGLVLALLVGCQGTSSEKIILKVGASPVPHAELLELVKEDLATEGIELDIIEFTDYVQPNLALAQGDLDANFFQHVPYQNNFAAEHGLELAAIASVHVEPLGLYSDKVKSIAELKEGSTIAIPADAVNGGRALILLEQSGLIKLADSTNLEATEKDIVENQHQFNFVAVEAAQLPRVLQDVDAAIINGNYALEAGFVPTSDAILLEGSESPYANVITVRAGEENNETYVKLVKALQSDKVVEFINENYGGGVVPAFN
ncbi:MULTISPECIES: MetQ/NlpA family ABC transporter substrate-binding protein [unclassified Fusibacter]|uniref:MetQ/NlpA family ABC transporter substrate-binding protein n=1 Tax=unclassified Fusibacter TaxID=2624464 RepID=UPI0010129782|nr:MULTISPECIES: MetQ/NlpA family ABC transporter substrate-binding protein [unclassified Fusibacter]MCK8058175.1 MetQ/NlpA family ABC transporter substrate-binding protein [Fusibacter sp. A2]NPE20758.1 ABC transporter substrate-binding protein [Fusibacter sp. A1]RXV62965.1 ABC transporter substrate-binding protein [Fusibacter sp. A1]